MERVVDRFELMSEHSTPPSSPDVKALRGLDDFEYVNYDEAGDQETGGNGDDDDEMDFLLFAPTANAADKAPEVAKIRVQTPPLTTGESGFIRPNRDDSYYFANDLSNDARSNFIEAAVTGQDVLARSRTIWPGSQYPWKVLQIQNTKRQRAIISNSNMLFSKLSDNPTDSKRRRPGKKARIKVRTKVAAAKARQDENRKAAEQKGAEEREKRTRRNREKKVKKKQREKAKKAETTTIDEDRMSKSPE